jgi:possible gp28 protein
MSKTGCIYTVAFRYYDIKTNKTRIKQRPFLIIKEEKSKTPIDLTVLPVSSITHKDRIDPYYDIAIDSKIYSQLNLNKSLSYIRTHKIQTVNEKDLICKICDNCNVIYPDLYDEIKQKVSEFYSEVL